MSIEVPNVHHAAASIVPPPPAAGSTSTRPGGVSSSGSSNSGSSGVDAGWTTTGTIGPLPTWAVNRGFTGDPVRNDAGDYLLTLETAVAETECSIQVTPRSGTTAAFATTEHLSPSLKRIRLFDTSGTFVDVPFDIIVHKITG